MEQNGDKSIYLETGETDSMLIKPDKDSIEGTSQEEFSFDINNLIEATGNSGRYQKLANLMLLLLCLPSLYQVLIMYFSTLTPSWKCKSNSSVCLLNGTQSPDDNFRCKIPRSEWYYTRSESFSLVTQWQLDCERAWKINLVSSTIFLGWAIGSSMIGRLSDLYGRKKVLIFSLLITISIGFLKIFCTNIYQISACQFIIGLFASGVQLQAFILISESVSDKDRATAGIFILLADPVSYGILCFKAYLTQNWKILGIISSLPYLLVVPFLKFIPESLTWLHFNGKEEDLEQAVRRIAKINKQELPASFKIEAIGKDENKSSLTLLEFFRKRRDVVSTLIQGYLWFSTACCYFGLFIAADDLQGSLYRDFAILTIIEFPSIWISIYLCDRFGRKPSTLIPIFVGSITCMVVGFVPREGGFKIVRVSLGMIGKFCITMTFNSVYTWSHELYSISKRCIGMTIIMTISRVGSMAAPWFVKGLKLFNNWLPFFTLGAIGLISSITALWLPETVSF